MFSVFRILYYNNLILYSTIFRSLYRKRQKYNTNGILRVAYEISISFMNYEIMKNFYQWIIIIVKITRINWS